MAIKRPSEKRIDPLPIWQDAGWRVKRGKLVPGPGRPSKTSRLFKLVAEKLPYEGFKDVRKTVEQEFGTTIEGVYLAHDSMGVARYGGRGNVFNRLATHKKRYALQLIYFSFYVIENKSHEREIETVILRAAGPQMVLNTRKIAYGLHPGDVRDYEPGTIFFERGGSGDFI